MTCIIGLVENDTVYMGGDSASATSWDMRITKLPKVFGLKNFLIGYTSSFRMGQLLQYQLTVPLQNGEDDMAYMVGTFIEEVRRLFKDNGYTKIENNQEEGGCFLVGYKRRLYVVHSDFQVNEHTDGFEAIGCGQDYALATMKALETLPPRDRITKALEIAAYFSNGVCAPFHIEELPS